MLAILCAHAVATALAPLLVYRYGRMAFYPLALVPLGSLVWVALNWPGSDVAGQAAAGLMSPAKRLRGPAGGHRSTSNGYPSCR